MLYGYSYHYPNCYPHIIPWYPLRKKLSEGVHPMKSTTAISNLCSNFFNSKYSLDRTPDQFMEALWCTHCVFLAGTKAQAMLVCCAGRACNAKTNYCDHIPSGKSVLAGILASKTLNTQTFSELLNFQSRIKQARKTAQKLPAGLSCQISQSCQEIKIFQIPD